MMEAWESSVWSSGPALTFPPFSGESKLSAHEERDRSAAGSARKRDGGLVGVEGRGGVWSSEFESSTKMSVRKVRLRPAPFLGGVDRPRAATVAAELMTESEKERSISDDKDGVGDGVSLRTGERAGEGMEI